MSENDDEVREDAPWLGTDEGETHTWHERWVRYYKATLPKRQEEWRGQCGGCRYYIPLTGALISDWGVCSNPASAFDGRAMFEHDGCTVFAAARDGWGGPHQVFDHLRRRHYTDQAAQQAARERVRRIQGTRRVQE